MSFIKSYKEVKSHATSKNFLYKVDDETQSFLQPKSTTMKSIQKEENIEMKILLVRKMDEALRRDSRKKKNRHLFANNFHF